MSDHFADLSVAVHGASKHDGTVVVPFITTYAGNGSTNRAVAHGLGRIPTFYMILDRAGGGLIFKILGDSLVQAVSAGSANHDHGTENDATNVYVGGNSAGGNYGNSAGVNYILVAI